MTLVKYGRKGEFTEDVSEEELEAAAGIYDLLAIPAFLRRAPGATARRVILRRRSRVKRPKGKKWRNADRVGVHLDTEAVRIGSGFRFVWAVTGRVWVHLADDAGRTGKLTIKEFERVKR